MPNQECKGGLLKDLKHDNGLYFQTKIDGVNSYNLGSVADIVNVLYCPSDPPVTGANGLPELDPDNTACSVIEAISPFATCKNNCRGGMYIK